jgi:NADPH-dependent curcumin reductase CurA
VGVVEADPSGRFKEGDIVRGYGGWQSRFVAKTNALYRHRSPHRPVPTALGVLGMPRFTAYAGLEAIGKPKPWRRPS